MRQLLIDQGNSRIKIAWCTQECLDVLPVANSVKQAIEQVQTSPDVVWLSSVADRQQTEDMREAIKAVWGIAAKLVTVPDYRHHLPTRYVADHLGVDRWLAMLACLDQSPGNCLVVDAGTAITLDVVNEQGEHQGGYILPGLNMSQQALLTGTSIEIPRPDDHRHGEYALDTAAAISQGILLSVLSLIEKLHARLGVQSQVFVGGGDAARLSASLEIPHVMVDHMVLRGLSRLALLEEE